MRHAHNETHSIAACIDCGLHIRKAGCSTEFNTHRILSVVMADRVFADIKDRDDRSVAAIGVI
jgi:hypothetical protein